MNFSYWPEPLTEAFTDCLHMLPFLFLAFLILEALEHHSGNFIQKLLTRFTIAGPFVGALMGCVPQCGFSVLASNLYAARIITLGTLVAVFMSTSDEAVLILLANPGHEKDILTLILVKVILAIIFGYITNLICKIWFSHSRSRLRSEFTELPAHHSHCDEGGGLLRSALSHTLNLFLYLLIFSIVIEYGVTLLGVERISSLMLLGSFWQPFLTALIGFIPNCAASVLLTELYLNGAISFASVAAGLCTNAGMGFVVLFQANRHKKENLAIMCLIYIYAVISGIVLSFIG